MQRTRPLARLIGQAQRVAGSLVQAHDHHVGGRLPGSAQLEQGAKPDVFLKAKHRRDDRREAAEQSDGQAEDSDLQGAADHCAARPRQQSARFIANAAQPCGIANHDTAATSLGLFFARAGDDLLLTNKYAALAPGAFIDLRQFEALAGAVPRSGPGLEAGNSGPAGWAFLDLPFYRTGQVRKLPIGPEDVAIVRALVEEVRPDVVCVAGDLSDPHGTHRMCKAAIDRALAEYAGSAVEVWLYRGAWQEWPITDADVLVPLAQEELRAKILAIFKHQSQKDTAPFPGGHDDREFWQRVEARNLETASRADRLGLPEYHAMEAYVVVEGQ